MISSQPLTVTQLNKYVKVLLEEADALRGLCGKVYLPIAHAGIPFRPLASFL